MKNSSAGMMLILIVLFATLIIVAWYLDFSKEWLIALFTAALSVLGWIYSSAKNAQRDIDARLFSEKAKLYKTIFNLFPTQLKKIKGNDGGIISETANEIEIAQQKLMLQFIDIKSELLIWGSGETIEAWIAMERSGTTDNTDPNQMLISWGKLYSSMRSDLGHFDLGIKAIDLVGFFLIPEDQSKLREK